MNPEDTLPCYDSHLQSDSGFACHGTIQLIIVILPPVTWYGTLVAFHGGLEIRNQFTEGCLQLYGGK